MSKNNILKTTEQFVKEAKEVHGNKYDYSKVNYVNNKTKVCIMCPEHGEFWQTPNNHLRGANCLLCYNNKRGKKTRTTKEQFIRKAREVHGWKYDYSKVNYVNNNTKVCIICPKHGEFWQTPNSHLNGNGCSKCSGKVRHTTETFVEKAKKIHGDKYDYSKVEYKNNKTKICIVCPEHGEFWMKPENHINPKQGCPKCANKKKGNNNKITQDEWLQKAKEVHGDKYDYSKVNYVNNHTKVCIICHKKNEFGEEHGEFWQTPACHSSNKQGCPKCGGNAHYTTETFIEKAREVHGDKYDYSKVEYKNINEKVCIICPEHGEFWQKPTFHIQGCGCQKCGIFRGVTETRLLQLIKEALPEVTVEYQKRFSWLGRQTLDIFIPKYNIAIECQGEQHFVPIDFFGGNVSFKKTIERDIRKNKLCEQNNIKLLYFVPEKFYKYNDLYSKNTYYRKDRLIRRILKDKKKQEKEEKKALKTKKNG